MSVLNQSGEELVECPLCMEPLEVDDLHFYPCTCGYQICRFCWNRIREGENGLCPACRKAYPENPADFTPLSQEQVAAIKTEKKAREQKRRNKTLESRRALANVRVVQNNLVFVVGLPVRLADPEILKRQEYFGKYGKIHKVVINQSTTYAGTQGPSASAYVTYVSGADALRAIQGVNNVPLDGRVLKGSLGTTKYCANFMKNQPCPKPDCMYLHELGDPKASFTKEEMHAGLHQVYERKLHNQLLNSQRDKTADKQTTANGSGNSSANESKSSSKDGNQSNFIPTTVVTSSNINVVNSPKCKKDSNSSSSGGSGKEAWPSLGASPPSDSPDDKLHSPKPHNSHVKSQENGTSSASSTSESSSPTQMQPQQAQTKTKHTDKNNRKDNTQNKKKDKTKHKNTNENQPEQQKGTKTYNNNQNSSAFDDNMYLTNELDELESDRHSLLENHDLLDNSDHSLLEDDTHNLLNDANNEVMMMQRHREMMAGLVDNHLLPHMKSPVNGFGLLDQGVGYLDRHSQINAGLLDQKDLLIRQNELLARQHNAMVEPKTYMSSASIGLESASELLGANFHQNPNMLPPFGMRVENSMGSSSIGNPVNMASNMTNMASNNMSSNMANNMTGNMGNMANSMTGNMGNMANSMTGNMGNMASNMVGNMTGNGGFMMQQHQMLNQHMSQAPLVNGYDSQQANSEGRYLAENMDKFFTDFHKAQQLRAHRTDEPHRYPRNMLSAERLEMEHKQRMSGMRDSQSGHRAAGDGDDDLDFDPFKETQKAFAELMETEMMQNQVSSGDNMDRVRRTRMAPPGFSHASYMSPHRLHTPHQGYMSGAPVSDWSQMDPAIMSVNVGSGASAALSQQQQELFARFSQLQAGNGVKLHAPPHKLPWPARPYLPLPPGFAPPAKQPQRPAECVDAN